MCWEDSCGTDGKQQESGKHTDEFAEAGSSRKSISWVCVGRILAELTENSKNPESTQMNLRKQEAAANPSHGMCDGRILAELLIGGL